MLFCAGVYYHQPSLDAPARSIFLSVAVGIDPKHEYLTLVNTAHQDAEDREFERMRNRSSALLSETIHGGNAMAHHMGGCA